MVREIKFNHRNNSYTVKFPNVGQWVDIRIQKASLTNGLYGAMSRSFTKDGNIALDLVDMQAFFVVMMPKEFWKDLKVDSLQELTIEDSLALLNDYNEQIVPFNEGIQKIIDDLVKKGKEKKEATNE
jgi:hypothetical protein